jgi:Tol biopolymer transport system component
VAVGHAINALLGLVGRQRLPGYWVTKIAYQDPAAPVGSSVFAIAVINEDGTNQRYIYGIPAHPGEGAEPAWSPDATKIAFSIALAPTFVFSRIAVMNPDGSGATTVSSLGPAVSAFSDSNPAWSPDGSTIVFHSGRSGHLQVWAMKTDGTGLVNVTNRPSGADVAPAWSPDGTQIAFVSDRSGARDIWTMDATGIGLNNLTKGLYNVCANPAWSSVELPPHEP